MAPFSKPETVLKQAEGLVSVGQTHAALQSLTEMFSSKRFRSTPLASLEPIMLRFVELCVDMRKGRTAKEGLMQYKNIAQNTSVGSIEVVISKFVALADAKVQEAQAQADKAVALTDVDDLEASETPESILLGAVSGDQSKDRTDRALVTPWLKFLWESYRTSLETLKNNARLEVIYQQIAQQAFKFCLKHQRKVEFRRLCETLRLHLANVAKYSHQAHAINLADPDTLQHHLDTRLAQLHASVELELWQEAFRSVEDVHNLLTMAKKAPRPAMMATYYEKLTRIFLMSGNALFHAAAWGKYYAVVTGIGGKSEEELGRLAGQVLVSALAVPVGQREGESAEEGKKNARLSALLGLARTPTRTGLLKDALSRDVLKLSPESIKSLYSILEVTFDPLTLCSSIAPLLITLSEDAAYAPYRPLLQRALLSRLLSQLSQVYSTVKIATLLELVAPLKAAGLEGALDDEQVEAYVMGCARRGELRVRVDHAAGSVEFVDEAYAEGTNEAGASQGIGGEGEVQPGMAEIVRTRLGKLAGSLHNSLNCIYPHPPSTLSGEEQQKKFGVLVKAAEAERKALRVRRALVARRRELLAELAIRKEKEETVRKAETTRREKELEGIRLKEDARKRELERAKREIESIRNQEAIALANTLKAKTNLKFSIDGMEDLSTDKLMKLQVDQLEKEKKELNERLRVVAKRVDHIERACRKEERPQLAHDYEEQQRTDRDTFVAVQAARIESARIAHARDVEAKGRLARMIGDYEARRDAITAKKGSDYEKRVEAAAKKIEEEKAKRRKSVMQKREDERRREDEEEAARRQQEQEEERAEMESRAQEEQRAEEEAAALAEEEVTKREAEEKTAANRKEREEQRAEAAEAARLQMQREEEAEKRREQRRAEERAAVRAPAPVAARPAAAASGEPPAAAWRRPGAAAPAAAAPPRAESPAAAPKFKVGGGGGGWRAREAERAAGGPPAAATPSPPIASPVATPRASRDELPKEDEGFQTVKKEVWKPKSRLQR